jgi:hypothetical protein
VERSIDRLFRGRTRRYGVPEDFEQIASNLTELAAACGNGAGGHPGDSSISA